MVPSNSTTGHTIPNQIGPYKIDALLERGGMSLLYLGTHPVTEEATIVKVLSPKYLSNPDVIRHFLKEAEIIALADHPNIVHLYGHGEWEGGLYIAMEFVQGVSLRSYLLHTPLSLRRALEITVDIAYALCHLHTHGVIHRDLKPENILVADSGAIKVIDFGIAQLLQEPLESEATQPGLMGTPVYMSPEQRMHPSAVGYPSDIYSLGIIAYELILGKLCLGQVHLSLMPKGLQKILSCALQPDPASRYLDIVDFITDISAYLHSQALEKEKPTGDYLSELLENLNLAYKVLQPPPPIWQGVECGMVVHRVRQVTAGFYEFAHVAGGGLAFLAGISTATGVENLLYTATLRGIVKTLHTIYADEPKKLITALNQLLAQDPTAKPSALSYLVMYPSEGRYVYVSYGFGYLMQLNKDGSCFRHTISPQPCLVSAEKIDVAFVEHSWHVGDTLVWWGQPPLSSEKVAPDVAFWEEPWWAEPFLNRFHTPMQKQLESAYRRAKARGGALWTQQPLNLVSIYRYQ